MYAKNIMRNNENNMNETNFLFEFIRIQIDETIHTS